MNNQGFISFAERNALIDIAKYQTETIKNKMSKCSKGLIITASYLYKNAKKIRKQNKKIL
jgi:hypothetical protein